MEIETLTAFFMWCVGWATGELMRRRQLIPIIVSICRADRNQTGSLANGQKVSAADAIRAG